MVSLDGTKLAGNAAQKANKTLPQIEKLLAKAAKVDAADDAQQGDNPPAATPRALAMRAGRAGRAERLAAARDRLAAEDQARRDAQRAKQEAFDAAAAAGNGARSAAAGCSLDQSAAAPAPAQPPRALAPALPAWWSDRGRRG